jgi:hypothetical protein
MSFGKKGGYPVEDRQLEPPAGRYGLSIRAGWLLRHRDWAGPDGDRVMLDTLWPGTVRTLLM